MNSQIPVAERIRSFFPAHIRLRGGGTVEGLLCSRQWFGDLDAWSLYVFSVFLPMPPWKFTSNQWLEEGRGGLMSHCGCRVSAVYVVNSVTWQHLPQEVRESFLWRSSLKPKIWVVSDNQAKSGGKNIVGRGKSW